MLKVSLRCAVALFLFATNASGQATRLVDPLDAAYLDLDQLIKAGLVERLSFGQRPLSVAVFARAIAEASRRLADRRGTGPDVAAGSGNAQSNYIRERIQALRTRLGLPPDSMNGSSVLPEFAPLRSITLDLTQTDQPTRLVPVNNGLGAIDASLNTLLAMRQGRRLVQGSNAFLESTHTLETRHFAFSATPQLSYVNATNAGTHGDLRLQEVQVRVLARNVALDAGREYVVWGQGRDVGLLNSNNSPPLDLIKLSSEYPFELPWIFRGLGPTRLAIFYADLGADQNFPHAHMVGYRANVAPFSAVDLGVSVYTKSGGRGAPRATLTARLIDLLPFLDASAYNNAFGTRGHFEFSDHYAGFDGRVRLPSLGSSIYWDVLMNDFDVRRLKSVLWEDAGHVFGLDLPPLVPSGRLRGSVEYHHTGTRYYEHQQFLSGQTAHHILTGDPLGPNAHGAYAHVDWHSSASVRAGLHVALERRSNDQYAYIPEPNFGFRRTEERPKESQARIFTEVKILPSVRQLGTSMQFGYQRTRNFNFVAGNGINGFVGRAIVTYRLR